MSLYVVCAWCVCANWCDFERANTDKDCWRCVYLAIYLAVKIYCIFATCVRILMHSILVRIMKFDAERTCNPRQQETTVTGGALVTVKSIRVPATMMKNTAAIEGAPEGLLGSANSTGVQTN